MSGQAESRSGRRGLARISSRIRSALSRTRSHRDERVSRPSSQGPARSSGSFVSIQLGDQVPRGRTPTRLTAGGSNSSEKSPYRRQHRTSSLRYRSLSPRHPQAFEIPPIHVPSPTIHWTGLSGSSKEIVPQPPPEQHATDGSPLEGTAPSQPIFIPNVHYVDSSPDFPIRHRPRSRSQSRSPPILHLEGPFIPLSRSSSSASPRSPSPRSRRWSRRHRSRYHGPQAAVHQPMIYPPVITRRSRSSRSPARSPRFMSHQVPFIESIPPSRSPSPPRYIRTPSPRRRSWSPVHPRRRSRSRSPQVNHVSVPVHQPIIYPPVVIRQSRSRSRRSSTRSPRPILYQDQFVPPSRGPTPPYIARPGQVVIVPSSSSSSSRSRSPSPIPTYIRPPQSIAHPGPVIVFAPPSPGSSSRSKSPPGRRSRPRRTYTAPPQLIGQVPVRPLASETTSSRTGSRTRVPRPFAVVPPPSVILPGPTVVPYSASRRSSSRSRHHTVPFVIPPSPIARTGTSRRPRSLSPPSKQPSRVSHTQRLAIPPDITFDPADDYDEDKTPWYMRVGAFILAVLALVYLPILLIVYLVRCWSWGDDAGIFGFQKVILYEIYTAILFGLPSTYRSRMEQVFREYGFKESELKTMGLQSAKQMDLAATVKDREGSPRGLLPQYGGFREDWENVIDRISKDWKTSNLIAVLLLSAILTILQIDAASEDLFTRYFALSSLMCSLISLLYGSTYIVWFGTMGHLYQAAEWGLELQRDEEKRPWWNLWVMLSMPVVYLVWSLILFICCIMAFLWRTGYDPNVVGPVYSSHTTHMVMRGVISGILAFGCVHGVLIARMLRWYGGRLRRAWIRRGIRAQHLLDGRESFKGNGHQSWQYVRPSPIRSPRPRYPSTPRSPAIPQPSLTPSWNNGNGGPQPIIIVQPPPVPLATYHIVTRSLPSSRSASPRLYPTGRETPPVANQQQARSPMISRAGSRASPGRRRSRSRSSTPSTRSSRMVPLVITNPEESPGPMWGPTPTGIIQQPPPQPFPTVQRSSRSSSSSASWKADNTRAGSRYNHHRRRSRSRARSRTPSHSRSPSYEQPPVIIFQPPPPLQRPIIAQSTPKRSTKLIVEQLPPNASNTPKDQVKAKAWQEQHEGGVRIRQAPSPSSDSLSSLEGELAVISTLPSTPPQRIPPLNIQASELEGKPDIPVEEASGTRRRLRHFSSETSARSSMGSVLEGRLRIDRTPIQEVAREEGWTLPLHSSLGADAGDIWLEDVNLSLNAGRSPGDYGGHGLQGHVPSQPETPENDAPSLHPHLAYFPSSFTSPPPLLLPTTMPPSPFITYPSLNRSPSHPPITMTSAPSSSVSPLQPLTSRNHFSRDKKADFGIQSSGRSGADIV